MPFPAPIQAYLVEVTVASRFPVYLKVDAAEHLVETAGDLSHYGLERLAPGSSVGEEVPFLMGALPLEGDRQILPCVETDSGVFADLHLFPAEGGVAILLLDATDQVERQRLIQQKSYDFDLLSQSQARMLDQYLGHSVTKLLTTGSAALKAGGERREATVLFADIRGFTAASEKRCPVDVFHTLNLSLQAMIRPILEEGGIVDNIMGDAVMAFFGLLEESGNPAQQAVRAAIGMMRAIGAIPLPADGSAGGSMAIGIGVATGLIAVGILGSKDRRCFSAVGHTINVASRLETQARASEVLIDENTFAKLDEPPERFRLTSLEMKGIAGSVPAYTCLLE